MNTSNITAIIPIKIDSSKRLENLLVTTNFLLKFFNFKIIIKEVDTEQKVFLEKNDRIAYIFEKTNTPEYFHRTKILNDMLSVVDTKYTINYDCDILLPQTNCYDAISLLESGYDVVFPYKKGSFLTLWDFNHDHLTKLFNDNDTSWLSYLINKYPTYTNHEGLDIFKTLNLGKIITCGGIQFFNTSVYKNGFGENEEFIDWGPEDQERLYRFYILGYNIGWINEGSVIHMNQPKSVATDTNNYYNKKNHELWDWIKTNIKTKKDMIDYMNNLSYVKNK
jgi:hypothetical protein